MEEYCTYCFMGVSFNVPNFIQAAKVMFYLKTNITEILNKDPTFITNEFGPHINKTLTIFKSIANKLPVETVLEHIDALRVLPMDERVVFDHNHTVPNLAEALLRVFIVAGEKYSNVDLIFACIGWDTYTENAVKTETITI